MIRAIYFTIVELAVEASLPARYAATDRGRWYEISALMVVVVAAEAGIATAVWSFLRLHGG